MSDKKKPPPKKPRPVTASPAVTQTHGQDHGPDVKIMIQPREVETRGA